MGGNSISRPAKKGDGEKATIRDVVALNVLAVGPSGHQRPGLKFIPVISFGIEVIIDRNGSTIRKNCNCEVRFNYDVYPAESYSIGGKIVVVGLEPFMTPYMSLEPIVQRKVAFTFTVPAKDFSRRGQVRLACEGMITPWEKLDLPEPKDRLF
jgi:hypothetical protein